VRYSAEEILPMRTELTAVGFRELISASDVDSFLADGQGAALIVINSVCGCAAGMMRPGARKALENERRPARIATAFAGQDLEAVERIREYLGEIPPSSPAIALFHAGELVFHLGRSDIEGSCSAVIAGRLVEVFDRYCS